MNVKRVKTVIYGCGNISDAYLSSITSKFRILEVVGCCDCFPEKAQEKAEKYKIKAMTEDEILNDGEIELIINLTPGSLHYETTKKLLEAGKHVYSEKTLAIELDEGAELVRLADEKGLYLGVAPDTFLGSAIQTARYVVESGMIGEISSFTANLGRSYRLFTEIGPGFVEKGWGIAFDVGIYYVTALLSILGPVQKVCGFMETRNPEGTFRTIEHIDEPYIMTCENIASGTLKFHSGVIGNLLFDSNVVSSDPERPFMAIYGSLGTVYLADPNLFGGEVKVMLEGNSEPFVMQSVHPYDNESRGLGAAEMAWSMRKNRKNRASKEMAYHALEVIKGMDISGKSGQIYEVKSVFEKQPALPRGYRNVMAEMISSEENAIAFDR